MLKNIPQEKVYLHTDKPYYSAGESIWFKAYATNAATHIPDTKSKFVYVELINAFDSVLYRVKIRKDSLGFSGNINLTPEIPAGDYVLRAYTYWMQNAGPEFFFKKQLKIGNTIDDRLFTNVRYGDVVNGYQPVIISLRDVNSKPMVGKSVKLTAAGFSKAVKPVILKSNQSGELNWRIPFDTVSTTKKLINLNLDEPSLKFSKQFRIPPASNDFDLQFFPESGTLINDNVQTVAFKAIGTNGLSVNVSAKVFDDKGNEVAEVTNSYKGMGKFSLFAQSGVKYYADFKTENGLSKRFSLPPVVDKGVSLKIISNKSKIFYEINNKLTEDLSKLFLLIHTRGVVLALQPLKSANGQIPDENLPAGITSFSVVDSLGNVFCERLFFVKNNDPYNINIQSDKNAYKKREQVALNFNISGADSIPVQGLFSLSVTDSKTVINDSTADNIETWFLLSSDLKGYIEQPADFFVNDKIDSREKLDLLMLTQGWRRFDLGDYLKHKFKKPEFYLEIGQAVSGKVLNIANKPSQNCDIIMLSNYNKTFRMAKTDTLGQFLIDGFEFPDSTFIMLKAHKKKSITDVEIIPDNDIFPSISVFIPFRNDVADSKLNSYLQAAKEKYYTEGGMRVINLDELTVTAAAKSTSDENSLYSGADNKITSESLSRYNGMSILNFLQTIPGILVSGENITIRGSVGAPLIIIDGFETENIEDISYLTTDDVEAIDVFKGASASIFGLNGGNGAIAITMKKGATVKYSTSISLSVIKPLGFQKPSAFYMPKYEVEEVHNSQKPDLRTTIYWADKLKTDEKGNIKLNFFTPDPPNNYNFILEGVSSSGKFIHKSGVIIREETLPQKYY